MNSVVHFEVPYDDKERASKFYSEVFDWKMQDMPEMDYTIVHSVETDEEMMPKKPGAINGGMVKREGHYKGPVIVIDVPDIDASLEKLKAAGGEVVLAPVEVGDMGRYSLSKDTEGNVIGVWQSLKK